MKIILFANSRVGEKIFEFICTRHRADLLGVVVTAVGEIQNLAKQKKIPHHVYSNDEKLKEFIKGLGKQPDYGILAWWPHILKERILNIPNNGFINTHPSLLPHARGKHYNFWTIVEEVPFGVSLHFVDKGIDSGDLISQEVIPYDWVDNGQSLFQKAQDKMVELFIDTYPKLRTGKFPRKKQNMEAGSIHYGHELHPASKIELDKKYTARNLLNLIRARTFPGHPSCWFIDNGELFEVKIEIKRKVNDESK